MKKALSYLVLFAYSTSMLMPLLPYISDKVAHTFWLYEHISTVHYEHGQYHSHYEAAAIAKKTSSEKGTPISKYSSVADDHDIASTTYHFHSPLAPKQLFISYELSAISAHLISDYPPPRS